MKSLIIFGILYCLTTITVLGQTKAELEERRKKALEEITYVDNMLQATAREKKESLSELNIIGNKLTLRESILSNIRQEINLLNERIGLNKLAIEMMERDLVSLRKDYRNAVLNSYRISKGYSELTYVLSARDFNQGYKRLKYLQQAAKFRRRETEEIGRASCRERV
jgi:hypothetical protein